MLCEGVSFFFLDLSGNPVHFILWTISVDYGCLAWMLGREYLPRSSSSICLMLYSLMFQFFSFAADNIFSSFENYVSDKLFINFVGCGSTANQLFFYELVYKILRGYLTKMQPLINAILRFMTIFIFAYIFGRIRARESGITVGEISSVSHKS